MTSNKNDNLKQYFDELNEWREENKGAEMAAIDELALLCLRIVTCLLNEQHLTNQISKQLLLLGDLPEPAAIEEDLLQRMKSIDEDLEENLRGFAGLMDFILEDTHVRQDPWMSLESLDNIDPTIVDDIGQLLNALIAHVDLDEAFSLSAKLSAAVLFVTGLSDVLADLMAINKRAAQEMVSLWLDERVKSKTMQALFRDSLLLADFAIAPIERNVINKDQLVILLCLWSACARVLKLEEALFLDQALSDIGMLGVRPLIEAGFLAVDENCQQELIGASSHLFPQILEA